MVRLQQLAIGACLFAAVSCSEPTPKESAEAMERVVIKPGFISLNDLNTFESAGSSISLIDVRKKSKYVLGHLPLARQVYRPSIQREDLPYEGAAISRLKFELLLDSLGVKPNDWIVAYDDKGGSDAARFCWLARLYGHSKATVLDGGLNYYALSNTLDTNDVKIKHSGYKYPDSPRSRPLLSSDPGVGCCRKFEFWDRFVPLRSSWHLLTASRWASIFPFESAAIITTRSAAR